MCVRVIRFFGGDDARVHRFDVPGGALFVGVRCLLDVTHSCAANLNVAKPNHAFFNCQHFVAIIFRGARRGTDIASVKRGAAVVDGVRTLRTHAARMRYANCFF